jgi:predicted nucleic acid-binding protein
MRVLIDTNIVLRAGGTRGQGNVAVAETVERLVAGGAIPCVAIQSLIEAWSVLTQPTGANGYGCSTAQARSEIDQIVGAFELLPEPATLFQTWLRVCSAHDVQGRQAFDARLVALMEALGITTLVTLNPIDFQRYTAINLVVPG